jgi:hypothetical protein
VLDKAGNELDKKFTGCKRRGVLLDALGRTYRGLGLSEKTWTCRERARCWNPLSALITADIGGAERLANALVDAGRRQEAIALRESTLKLFESKLGPNDRRTLQCRNDLGADYWFAGDTRKRSRCTKRAPAA